jgi:hypothetical protein
MQVALVIRSDDVEVIFTNNSKRDLRLWDTAYSWGYWSISFQLSNKQYTSVSTIIRDWNTEFTVNGPIYYKLAPGEELRIPLNLKNGEWMRNQTTLQLKDQILSIRVSYRVNPTPEADQHDVFVGSIMSDWVTAEPPHGWLFTQLPYRAISAERLLQYPPDEVLNHIVREIDILAWYIEAGSNHINRDSNASSQVLDKAGTTVGHVGNSILENARQIRKTITEFRAYLEAKVPPEASEMTDTNN